VTADGARRRPLDGIRVLELGQLVAGPFAATILGYFGAEVIKVEPPGTGDPIRGWRLLDPPDPPGAGTSLWWRSLGRNKKCVAIDLRREQGRALVRRLAAQSDVLVENFKPGTLERWGMSPAQLRSVNPRLVIARVSGFGQTGPRAQLPGYASIAEGYGGLRYVNGEPGGASIRPNLSLGDTVAGIHAALGVLLALFDRERGGAAETVDVSIVEAVFNLMEAAVPEYDRLGAVRGPSGSTITGVVPSNLYPTRDGWPVIIGGNNEAIFRRLMEVVERPDLAADPALAGNAGRVARREEIDRAIGRWTEARDRGEVIAAMEAAGVPVGPIYSVADMVTDAHFQARGLFEEVVAPGGPLKVPAIAPRLETAPGRSEWAGPEVGEHTDQVLRERLGLAPDEIARLRSAGVI
jgi:crotonobetainyl-CoA:carnitine CoA-transferase CaiB-like acyl-CoA transferase